MEARIGIKKGKNVKVKPLKEINGIKKEKNVKAKPYEEISGIKK